jgi:hypothetical protein
MLTQICELLKAKRRLKALPLEYGKLLEEITREPNKTPKTSEAKGKMEMEAKGETGQVATLETLGAVQTEKEVRQLNRR